MKLELRKTNIKICKDLIYISAGDRETFATYAADNLSARFDIAIFFYGKDQRRAASLEKQASIFAVGSGTKFNSYKMMLEKYPALAEYESVWICDDDIIPSSSEIVNLPTLLKKFNLKVISPAHSSQGKISHKIMLTCKGDQTIRYVNFVEMTCPMFSSNALNQFIHAYDGSLAGWGVDWWYLNFFKADDELVAAVTDQYEVINPYDNKKQGSGREIDKFMNTEQRQLQWFRVMKQNGFKEWRHNNFYWIFMDSSHKKVSPEKYTFMKHLIPRPARPLVKSIYRMFFTSNNI